MSWFSRIFGQSRAPSGEEAARYPMSDRRRAHKSSGPDSAPHATFYRRKSDRAYQREQLHKVVREAMISSGVLSAHYKFKVLSVDQEGTQFLVMIDLSADIHPETHDLVLMEAAIVQRARSQRKMQVMAVYWRMAEQAAVTQPGKPPPARHAVADPAVEVAAGGVAAGIAGLAARRAILASISETRY